MRKSGENPTLSTLKESRKTVTLKPLNKTSEWRVVMEEFRRGSSEKNIRVKYDSGEFEDQCGQQGKGKKMISYDICSQ